MCNRYLLTQDYVRGRQRLDMKVVLHNLIISDDQLALQAPINFNML